MSNNTQAEVTVSEAPALKRQPGLGKLNRLTKSAQQTILANMHTLKRFKRDYADGTATYTCPVCGATAVAMVSGERGGSSVNGTALTTTCKVSG